MFTNLPPVTKGLLIINCAVFVLQLLLGPALDPFMLWPWLPPEAAGQGLPNFMPWQLLTHGFMHSTGNPAHLLFNMLALWSFGTAVEQVFTQWLGRLGFVLFYLSAIVVSILPTYISHRRDPNYRSLGASGGVSAVLFSFILFDPWSTLIIFPIPLPIPAFLFAVLYVGYSIWMDRRGRDNVNHSAHLWGAAYGVLFTVLLEPRILGHFVQTLLRTGSP